MVNYNCRRPLIAKFQSFDKTEREEIQKKPQQEHNVLKVEFLIPYSFDYNSHSISVRIRLVFAIFRNFSEKKTNSVRTRLVFAMKIGFVSFDLTSKHLLVYLNFGMKIQSILKKQLLLKVNQSQQKITFTKITNCF